MEENDKKFCPGCEQELELGEFWANRRNKDGKQIYCKSCQTEMNQSWKAKHPGFASAYTREYEKKHPDKAAEWQRKSIENRRQRMKDPEFAERARAKWRKYYYEVVKPRRELERAVTRVCEHLGIDDFSCPHCGKGIL